MSSRPPRTGVGSHAPVTGLRVRSRAAADRDARDRRRRGRHRDPPARRRAGLLDRAPRAGARSRGGAVLDVRRGDGPSRAGPPRDEPLTLRAVGTGGWNGSYVDDRRSGQRERVGEMHPTVLTRHEVDELYGAVLVEGIDATLTVLAGAGLDPVLPTDFYRRLTSDLAANGRPSSSICRASRSAPRLRAARAS